MPAWEENDELFFSELRAGHQWSEYVAAALRKNEIKCHVEPVQYRDSYDDRKRFQNEQDIILDAMPGCIEVKSRRLAFGETASSYPFSTALVDTSSGWERKKPKPLAVVLVSQQTGSMLIVPVSTRSQWGIKTSFDRVRGIDESWLTIRKNQLRSFSELVSWLEVRQGKFQELSIL